MEGPDMTYDVAIIGGGLGGSLAAVMLARRGLSVCVLESRPEGKEQKVVVGEAMTEGSSVFLRHEIGMTDWLSKNAFRKFGFDFLILPRTGQPPRTMNDCHELLMSLTPLEKIAGAFKRLIPTYHVERTGMNAEAARLAREAGARYAYAASVERVVFGDPHHTVHYSDAGTPRELGCKWVLDASGRRTVLGRQLGITHPVRELNTAAVWNRFENVNADPEFWKTFQGVDRRKHTIHMTGQGFWIWWIHQNDNMTSVGVSYDKDQHQPDVKTDDRGFWEMLAKFPPIHDALKNARPLEPYQYYAHLPYQSEHWLSDKRYLLLGDAAWFTDALYSIGVETTCRQLVAAVPMIVDTCRGQAPCTRTIAKLNMEFDFTQQAVVKLNAFKYRHAWGHPYVAFQTALYELGEIAELYHMQAKSRWLPEVLDKHYRMQWGTEKRMKNLERFMHASLADSDRDLAEPGLLKKALLPGWTVYGVTWALWQLPHARPWFFILTRGWGFVERWAQRKQLWPDGLAWMASGPTLTTVINQLRAGDADMKAKHAKRSAAGS
jgi:flavin-dependent dehydrogenase